MRSAGVVSSSWSSWCSCSRPWLTRSRKRVRANAAGFLGTLPQKFLLTGHSAGGRFATAAGAGTVDNGSSVDLLGVVMFDGVSRPPTFNEQLQKLIGAGIPGDIKRVEAD